MLKKWLFIIVGLSVLQTHSSAQTTMSIAEIKRNTVEIYGGENGQDGSGLIIGKSNDELQILTARHVVGTLDSVLVKLEGTPQLRRAVVEQVNEVYDLALLAVGADDFEWKPYTCVKDILPGDSVFIVSAHRDKIKIPTEGSGIVNDLDKTTIIANVRGIVPGDSGSPLWTNDGLVGMIKTRSPVQALPIALIKEHLIEDWGKTWQLSEKLLYRAPVENKKVPDFSDVSIPVSSITSDGKCKSNLSDIADNNVNTSWVCDDLGWQTITFTLEKMESVRKIKLFDNDNDVPVGIIEIPNSNFKVRLNNLLVNHIETDKTGRWYVFDFGKFITTNQIILKIKVREGLKQNTVEPLYIAEMKISGLKTN